MNILFLSQLLPYPLDSGVKFRMYYTLRQLAKNHKVTLLCFVRPDNTPEQIAHLQTYCQSVQTVLMRRSAIQNAHFLLESLITGSSFIISRDRMAAMQEKLDNIVQEAQRSGAPFDAVHCDQLWMAQYALRVGGVKKVLDQHNAVYMIPKRMARQTRNPFKRVFLEQEWRKLACYEARVCRQFDQVLTVTEVDRQLLEELMGKLHMPVTSFPICLDAQETQIVQRVEKPEQILHLGTMYWLPNVEGVLWFAREVFPMVRRSAAATSLAVVGKNPPPSVQMLANQPGIEVPGYVADPQAYLERCAAFIVPVGAGGGMRVKIIDAWMRGLPVVSTTIGAEGIDIQPGENILIADEPGTFAQAVVDLIQNPELGRRLAQNGRWWAEQHYDWRAVYPVLDDIYAKL